MPGSARTAPSRTGSVAVDSAVTMSPAMRITRTEACGPGADIRRAAGSSGPGRGP